MAAHVEHPWESTSTAGRVGQLHPNSEVTNDQYPKHAEAPGLMLLQPAYVRQESKFMHGWGAGFYCVAIGNSLVIE